MKKIYAHFRLEEIATQKLHHSGGVTVYGEWNANTKHLRAMGAVCTVEDNYNYKRGRIIAEGRFNKHRGETPSLGGTLVNFVYEWDVENERQVHDRLGSVADTLAFVLRTGEEFTMKRYYRSSKGFGNA